MKIKTLLAIISVVGISVGLVVMYFTLSFLGIL